MTARCSHRVKGPRHLERCDRPATWMSRVAGEPLCRKHAAAERYGAQAVPA